MINIKECPRCGHIPMYIGNNTYGYYSCPSCHLRTLDCFDTGVQVIFKHTFNIYGNIVDYREPNAKAIAEHAWNTELFLEKDN